MTDSAFAPKLGLMSLCSLIFLSLLNTACGLGGRDREASNQPASSFEPRPQTPYTTAQKHYDVGEFKQAFAIRLRIATDPNDGLTASAQLSVGDMFLNGEGVSPDVNQAIYWYQQAAASTNEKTSAGLGASRLGALYLHEEHIKKDLHQAAYWYDLAAGLGSTSAKKTLDMLLEYPDVYVERNI